MTHEFPRHVLEAAGQVLRAQIAMHPSHLTDWKDLSDGRRDLWRRRAAQILAAARAAEARPANAPPASDQ